MRIDVVNNAEGYSEERLASLDGYIVRLSEAVLSGDYSSPQVTRSLKDAYATLTFVTSDEIREVNLEQREIDKETDCLSFPMLELKDGSFEMIPDSGDFETDEEGNQVLCHLSGKGDAHPILVCNIRLLAKRRITAIPDLHDPGGSIALVHQHYAGRVFAYHIEGIGSQVVD